MSHGIEQDTNGYYGLCVFEADTLTDEEVREVFEKFGKIVNFNRSKNLVFIRYSTLEEAVQCYEDMQGNSKFRVKPAKRKVNSDTPDYQRRERFDDQNKGREMNYRKSDSDFKQSPVRQMPNLKYDMPNADAPLTTAATTVCKRVTVGHLHPDMKQADVYNLCNKARASPVQVDMRSFTRQPYPPARYAIVYVKNETDVQNIVRGLNNLKVNGYQLIVAPYEKLIEEGKTARS